MIFAGMIYRQLAHPAGWGTGRIISRIWNRRNAALNDVSLNALNVRPGDRVIEVGFGGGYLIKRIADVATGGIVAGVDISETLVRRAKRIHRCLMAAGRVELQCADAGSLPYPSGYFSRAASVNSIFYWKIPQAGVLEMVRVLEKGGRMVICFTDRASLEKQSFLKNHIHMLECHDVIRMMERSGLKITEITHHEDAFREYHCAVGLKP